MRRCAGSAWTAAPPTRTPPPASITTGPTARCAMPPWNTTTSTTTTSAPSAARSAATKSPAADFAATALDLSGGTLTIDNAVTVQLAFRSIYNVYNILAAYAACRCAGAARTPSPASSTTTCSKTGGCRDSPWAPTAGCCSPASTRTPSPTTPTCGTSVPPTAPARAGDRGRGEPEVLHQRDQLAVGHRLRPSELPPMWSGWSSPAGTATTWRSGSPSRTFPGKES